MPLILLSLALPLRSPVFDPDVAHWRSIPIPPKSNRGNRAVWEYAAGYSTYEWRVVGQGGHVQARLGGDKPLSPPSLPSGLPKGSWKAVQRVSDGWLLGTNHGEWGGSLSWASADGKRMTKVSNDQIVAFFRLPGGLYAVEGLAHLGISRGSLLRLEKRSGATGWKATKVLDLPGAPYAVATRQDGTALVVLSDGVVAFAPGRPLQTLLQDAPWWGLYPNSAVLSSDGRELFIGMRQYVGVFDLRTNALRLLVPSRDFLNRLSKDDERIVRAQARG